MGPLEVAPPSKPFLDSKTGAWVLSRYSDVSAALRDPRLQAGVNDREWHAQYREQAFSRFSAPTRWEAPIEAAARDLAPASGILDVCQEVVRPWSGKVACLVTGLPLDQAAQLQPLSAAVFAAAAEPFDFALQKEAAQATRILAGRFPADTAGLSVQAFVALSESLAAFVVNAWYTLLTHETNSANLDELLRYGSPSRLQLRRAAERVEIGDVTIPEGSTVLLDLASANRDPEVFPAPDLYDARRSGAKHLAFGSGPHSCAGSALIKVAASVGLLVFKGGQIVKYEKAEGLALRSFRSLVLDLGEKNETPVP